MKLAASACAAFLASLALIPLAPRLHLEATGVDGLYARATIADLGPVDATSGAAAEFELLNHGSRPLKMESVETDCACTVAHPIETILLPGDRRSVTVTIKPNPQFKNANRRPLHFEHRCIVRISRQDEDQRLAAVSPVVLRIIGTFKPHVTVTAIPAKIFVGSIRTGEYIERDVQFEGPAAILSAIPAQVLVGCGSTVRLPVPNPMQGSATAIQDTTVRVLANDFAHESFESHLMLISADGNVLFDIPIGGSVSSRYEAPGTLQ